MPDSALESRILPPNLIEPPHPVVGANSFSRTERNIQLERTFHGLYRWYVARSQQLRNWNPDTSFDWAQMRPDHSSDVVQLIEGFFAVEQYVPDYTSKIINLVRRSFGRSHFQIRWGSEEERHAESWENALLFSRQRTPTQIEEYKHDLRSNEWRLPWDDPLHMLIYTVFQERATQLNYLNFAKIARGDANDPAQNIAVDPVLERVCTMLAVDEAAHYGFFLEGARLYLYYFPEETLEAIHNVITHFSMPAQAIIPNWDAIAEVIYRTGVYGPRDYQRNVLTPVFNNLSVVSRKALENGIKRSRIVPTIDGNDKRETALWDVFDPSTVVKSVKRLHSKIVEYEKTIGRDAISPLEFVENPDWPTA